VADREDLSYGEKLGEYQRLADEYFERDKYRDFCAEALPDVDDMVLSWISSAEFDEILRDTVVSTYPAHEQDQFLAHFRGLLDLWIRDQQVSEPAGSDVVRE
jgi:hypothetical protein